MSHTRVVVLLGSLRADSLNRRIVDLLRAQAPAGVELEVAEGLDQIPFYNEEIDGEQVPAAARRLREVVGGADRVLAVTPEYNGTMPAVLNNAIDWLSRPYGVGAISGKPFAAVGRHPDAVRRQVVPRRRAPLRPDRRRGRARARGGLRVRPRPATSSPTPRSSPGWSAR